MITIGGKEYDLEQTLMDIFDLRYFIENPRVYSLFDRSSSEPTQEQMEERLFASDDVRDLRDTIEGNGGLVNPIIVRLIDNVVVEGNRRLASYRMLYKKKPDKWRMIPVSILPPEVTERELFIYLGHIHINGQKDWMPFEQAGYIYRTIKKTGTTLDVIAKELGMKKNEIKKRYDVYCFMVEHNDLESNHWSYYEEYLKSRAIKSSRAVVTGLDEKVVQDIKAGKIADAKSEIRETLAKIADSKQSIELLTDYVENKKSLDQCLEEANLPSEDFLKMFGGIKQKMYGADVNSMVNMISEDDLDGCIFELDMIVRRGIQLKKMLEERKK